MLAPLDRTLEQRVLRALRRAWLLVATDDEQHPHLGYASSPTFRHFTQTDYWVLFALARELGCTIEEVRSSQDRGRSSVDRMILRQKREAAYRLIEELGRLTPSVARVVEARARNVGWREVVKFDGGRAFFSAVQDLRDGCRLLNARVGDLVEILQ